MYGKLFICNVGQLKGKVFEKDVLFIVHNKYYTPFNEVKMNGKRSVFL